MAKIIVKDIVPFKDTPSDPKEDTQSEQRTLCSIHSSLSVDGFSTALHISTEELDYIYQSIWNVFLYRLQLISPWAC